MSVIFNNLTSDLYDDLQNTYDYTLLNVVGAQPHQTLNINYKINVTKLENDNGVIIFSGTAKDEESKLKAIQYIQTKIDEFNNRLLEGFGWVKPELDGRKRKSKKKKSHKKKRSRKH